MSKYIPILFSTEMVQAILEGRKKMTRRTKGLERINANPDEWAGTDKDFKDVSTAWIFFKGDEGESIYCPYGQVGDILWVRESFLWVMNDHCHDLMEGRRFVDNNFVYKASEHKEWIDYAKEKYGYKWKPSIHMPKSACRIFLRVTDVRCERLHDITEQDAIDEGVIKIADYGNTGYKLYTQPEASFSDIDAVYSFESLWASINGQSSWDANPYVWVVSFERCERPVDFLV